MQLINNMKKRLTAHLKSSHLTISGEIVIKHQGMQPLNAEEVKALTAEDLSRFRQHFPEIRLQTVKGLCDVTIKFFAYQKYIYAEDFYTEMDCLLSALLASLEAAAKYEIRLNIYGSLQEYAEVMDFHFLNKGSVVSHTTSLAMTRKCPGLGLRTKVANSLSHNLNSTEN